MAAKNVILDSKKKRVRALFEAGQRDAAVQLLQELCIRWRADTDLWLLRGSVNGLLGRHEEAQQALETALSLNPNTAEAHYNLGIALRAQNKYESALAAFREAVRLNPNHALAHDCAAHACGQLGRLEECAHAYESALYLPQGLGERWCNLTTAYQALGRLEEAVGTGYKAMALRPRPHNAHANLGSALTAQGRHAEALDVYRQALSANPDDSLVRSNLLLTLNYLEDIPHSEVFQAHLEWGKRHHRPLLAKIPVRDATALTRPLRVGFVSSDFRTHSVAYFVEPILRHHDPGLVSIHCYANLPETDETTTRLQSYPAAWHTIHGLDDRQAAEQIFKDRIDILVDLGGHTGNSRLVVFAHKPAPVQVTYLGYPNTTGLAAMDYRLTDALADPEGAEAWHSEHLHRLPGCFLCYQPPLDAPPVREATPALESGAITFGSFNNAAKIGPAVIRVWAAVLKAVPGARLLLKNPSFSDTATRQRFAAQFVAEGVDESRLEFVGHVAGTAHHLAIYHQVDIALDTFPYNGTTTTCEALWMGVPVMTLAGQVHAGRVGLSLLANLGLDDWIAGDEDEFIRKTVSHARDLEKLSAMRSGMRERMAQSALCDGAGFARRIEQAFYILHEQPLASIGNAA